MVRLIVKFSNTRATEMRVGWLDSARPGGYFGTTYGRI